MAQTFVETFSFSGISKSFLTTVKLNFRKSPTSLVYGNTRCPNFLAVQIATQHREIVAIGELCEITADAIFKFTYILWTLIETDFTNKFLKEILIKWGFNSIFPKIQIAGVAAITFAYLMTLATHLTVVSTGPCRKNDILTLSQYV